MQKKKKWCREMWEMVIKSLIMSRFCSLWCIIILCVLVNEQPPSTYYFINNNSLEIRYYHVDNESEANSLIELASPSPRTDDLSNSAEIWNGGAASKLVVVTQFAALQPIKRKQQTFNDRLMKFENALSTRWRSNFPWIWTFAAITFNSKI